MFLSYVCFFSVENCLECSWCVYSFYSAFGSDKHQNRSHLVYVLFGLWNMQASHLLLNIGNSMVFLQLGEGGEEKRIYSFPQYPANCTARKLVSNLKWHFQVLIKILCFKIGNKINYLEVLEIFRKPIWKHVQFMELTLFSLPIQIKCSFPGGSQSDLSRNSETTLF